MKSSKNKINLLFKHRSMEMGGVEKVLLNLLENLDKNKFEISLSLNLNQGELRNFIPLDIKTYRLTKGKEDFPANIILNKFCLLFRSLKLKVFKIFPIIPNKFIINNIADVEIALGFTMFDDVLNSSNKKSKKIGWFHTEISYLKDKKLAFKLAKQIEKFDYIFFGSKQTYQDFINEYPNINLPPHQVIRNPIFKQEIIEKSNEFIPDIISKDLVLVSVGRLDSRKGHNVLIDVHLGLLKKGIKNKIYIIGDGIEREKLLARVNKHKINETFILLGSLINPYPYIKNSDIFVLPSESEGWPLILAETLILKKHIIATNVGGVSEIINHKENGYLVNYNKDDIQKGVEELISNEVLFQDIENKLEKNIDQFNNAEIYNTIQDVILNLLKKT